MIVKTMNRDSIMASILTGGAVMTDAASRVKGRIPIRSSSPGESIIFLFALAIFGASFTAPSHAQVGTISGKFYVSVDDVAVLMLNGEKTSRDVQRGAVRA